KKQRSNWAESPSSDHTFERRPAVRAGHLSRTTQCSQWSPGASCQCEDDRGGVGEIEDDPWQSLSRAAAPIRRTTRAKIRTHTAAPAARGRTTRTTRRAVSATLVTVLRPP